MCIKTDKKNRLAVLKLDKRIYPENVVDEAMAKSQEKFEVSKRAKKNHYVIEIKGSKGIDLETLAFEFANYLLYFSKRV